MRIAVMGLETFGFHLARVLNELGDEVMAVDRDEGRVQEIMRYVGKAVVADVADREALKDLGIRGMDVVAVDVGERFETSVLLTHYLRELGIPRVLVKAANADQAKILTLIGASDVVQPEQEIAVKTAHLIHYSRSKLLDAVALGDGCFVITVQGARQFHWAKGDRFGFAGPLPGAGHRHQAGGGKKPRRLFPMPIICWRQAMYWW
jgi:trk system potassium uptake protein TrkA